jgi:hypothetical protein
VSGGTQGTASVLTLCLEPHFIPHSNSQFRRNALYALVGSVSSIYAINMFSFSFCCSAKQGRNTRLRHDRNWATRYSLELSCPISFHFVCNTTSSCVHVYVQATMCKQKMHSKNIHKMPTCCTSPSLTQTSTRSDVRSKCLHSSAFCCRLPKTSI